jgi:hypothetical protein
MGADRRCASIPRETVDRCSTVTAIANQRNARSLVAVVCHMERVERFVFSVSALDPPESRILGSARRL